MRTFFLPKALLFIALLVSISACRDGREELPVSVPAEAYSAEAPLRWYQLFQELDRYTPGYRPPAAARMLAYTGLAGYEAAVNGMPEYRSLAGHFAGLALPSVDPEQPYHWPTAVNAAYHAMFVRFYPHIQAADLDKIHALEHDLDAKYAAELEPAVFQRSKAYGLAVAEAVYDWSVSDAAGHQAYLNPRPADYVPPSGPGLWQPSYPDFTPALFPYWGQVRTFALKGADLQSRPPLPFAETPDALIYQQAREVETWVNKIKSGQDQEGRWIAEFWSDDIFQLTFEPAGRWIAIANQVVDIEQPSLETAVELYAKMGMALCDAGIAIWKGKFEFNYERPVHYIRRNFDPNWTSLLNNQANNVVGMTPEFPAYPSGHSGFGGAGASVLTEIFGNFYFFIDNCHKDRTEFMGLPRSFNSFTDMAVENAYSRIPLGVHFRMDCDEGLRLGNLAGQRVLELPWKK
jgi:hypothetical protein